jgi:hypothetical protein
MKTGWRAKFIFARRFFVDSFSHSVFTVIDAQNSANHIQKRGF